MKLVKLTIIISCIAVVFALISAILFIVGCDYAGAIGIVATVVSVILSLVSIIYTYISGKETIKSLKNIEKQNEQFIIQIKSELLNYNYDEENIKDVRKND